MTKTTHEQLHDRAHNLKLWGLLAHWEHYVTQPWLEAFVKHQEVEQQRRSLERRIQSAKIGRFKLMSDFDWSWPEKSPRTVIEELFSLQFITEPSNVVFIGPTVWARR